MVQRCNSCDESVKEFRCLVWRTGQQMMGTDLHCLTRTVIEDLTENRNILNKYNIISLFLENVVSSNIEISHMRPEPISPNTLLNKSRKWSRWLFDVYQQKYSLVKPFFRLQMRCKF